MSSTPVDRSTRRADHIGPSRAGFDLKQAALLIQRDGAGHFGHVDQKRIARELLRAHRMSPAADADLLSSFTSGSNERDEVADVARASDIRDDGAIQPRVHIVDDLHDKPPR